MASIYSSTSSTSGNALSSLSGKGIGGLVSGLDTDTLVNALVAGTTSRIAKQGQDKQILNWKMTAYRSAATQLSAFQKKHFDYASSGNTNIMSSGFWNTYKATSSSSKVSATATANSTIGNITIDRVQSLATAETLTSKPNLTTELTLNLKDGQAISDGYFTGQTLKLDVNGSAKTIKLDDLNAFISNGELDFDYYDANGNPVDGTDSSVIAGSKFQDKLQELVDKAFGTKGVWDEDGGDDNNGGYNYISIVSVSLSSDGKIKLDSDSSKIIVAADNSKLGVDEGDSNRVDLSTKLSEIDAFKNLQGEVFTFSINGTNISVSKNDTLSTLMSNIKTSDAGVDLTYSAYTDEFTLTSKTTGAGENIVVEDVYGDLMNIMFGTKSAGGVSSNYLTAGNGTVVSNSVANFANIDWSNTAAVKALGSTLKYMSFEMTIDGVTKTVRADTASISATIQTGTFTLADMYNAINKGIKNAFTGTSVQLGAEYDLYDGDTRIDKTNVNGDGYIQHKGLLMDSNGREVDANGNGVYKLSDGTKLAYDKSDKSWYVLKSDGSKGDTVVFKKGVGKAGDSDYVEGGWYVATEVKGTLNDSRLTQDGNGDWYLDDNGEMIKVNYTADVGVDGDPGYVPGSWSYIDDSVKADGIAAENVKSQNSLAVSKWTGHTNIYGNGSAVTIDSGGILQFLGINAKTSNVATGSNTLESLTKNQSGVTGGTLTINGKTGEGMQIEYTSTTTISELVSKINTAFAGEVKAEFKNGKLSINGVNGEIEIEDTGNLLNNLFGIIGGSYKTTAQDVNYDSRHKAGSNAEVLIDGKVLSYSTNSFTLNGVNITVNSVSEKDDAPITVGVASDVDDVITRIKGWMDDYNALVYSLNSMINEGKDSDYFPLTDEQKADMTEDQITKWETEAKKGILRNDSTLRSILSDLRQTLYERVESAGISLFDLGITTKAYGYTDPNEAGQLCFDEIVSGGGEAKLKAMLESEPDKVRMLFTDSQNGLATRMNTLIKQATDTSSTNRGSLVTLAGTEILTGDNTSVLGDKISAIDKYVNQLKLRLESEYTRYWKKFSALETAVQRLSVQSSWFSQ